jgi:class 3 adenylate cyclase
LNTFVDRLLPKHIKGVATASTEKYQNVTLLFADIVGFTEYSAGKNPRQVVEMLSQLFTAFDKECNKLNLYKLYTIGDCYVVMSFLDKNNRKKPKEEASDVVQLSIFMIKVIKEVRKKINFEKLDMRIGIHTVNERITQGTVYGGVIGTDIVRFDLYGPDVLTANKMESGGMAGRVNISETTKTLLDDLDKTNYSFQETKEIEIKALNKTLKSHFLKIEEESLL